MTVTRPVVLSALAGAAALLAASVPAGPSLTAVAVGTAADRAAALANGPSRDHLFRMEATPRTTLADLRSAANVPPSVDPTAFDYSALQAAQKLATTGSARWKQVGAGGGIVEDAARGALVEGRKRNTGIVLSLADDPRDKTGKTVYTGTGGGLWKTVDGGKTWKQMAIPLVPVGGVGVDPADPDLVVAATGQAFQGGGEGGALGVYVSRDAGRTWSRPARNVAGNGGQQVSIAPDAAHTVFVATDRGLFRSRDHGASFSSIPLPTDAAGRAPATGTPVGSWVSDVKVRPGHPSEIYAAVGYVAGNVTLYDGTKAAPGNGLYRSVDGGSTFRRVDVSSATTGWKQNPTGSSDPIGRIRLAFAPNGNDFYALVADAGLRSARSVNDAAIPLGLGHDTSLNGVYMTSNPNPEGAAPSWGLKADSETLTAAPGGSQVILSGASELGYQPGIQAWYNGWIAVDPVTPTRIFLGEEETYVSVSDPTRPGPTAFTVIDRYISPCALATSSPCPAGTPVYGGESNHPDQHAGLPVPGPTGTRLYSGNDGGVFYQDSHTTTDGSGFDDEKWVSGAFYNTLLPYRAVKASDGSVIAGLQDNGTVKYYPGTKDPVILCGGDGSAVAVDPDRPGTLYCEANGSLSVSTDGGKTTSDAGSPAAPAFKPAAFQMDPTNAKHLVIGDATVYETAKGSASVAETVPGVSGDGDWKAVFSNPGSAPVIALDTYGANVYDAYCSLCASSVKAAVTSLDRGLATNVKPGCQPVTGSAACWHVAAMKGMPSREVQGLAIDPTNPRNVYVATSIPSVVRVDLGGVAAPRVLLSTDAGESVKDVSGNLPRGNVWDVKVAGKRVYVATDLGVFTAPLGGRTWTRAGQGLPVTRVYGLSISAARTELVASTYGAGVWTVALPGGKASLPRPTTALPTGTRTTPTAAGGTGSSSGRSAGGRLAATGLPLGLPLLAAGLLVAAGVVRRRRQA